MEEKMLTPLRDITLPPSGVDLHRAVHEGRRQVRRRRTATAASAGLAVVAVLAAAPAVLGHADRSAPVVPMSPPPTSASVAPVPDRAPTAFDPTRQYADFGWLPAGLTDRTVATGTAQLALNVLSTADLVSSDSTRGAMVVDLQIVSAGHDIALDGPSDFAVPIDRGGSADLEPAEPVNGRPARWRVSDASGAALRWEYAPDAWAEVIVQGVPEDSDPRALARRIAEDVRYGVDRPIRMPVRLANLPAGLKPMAYMVATWTDGSWNVELSYGNGKRTKYNDWPLVVQLMTRSSTSPGDNAPLGGRDSTIDGHPARRWSSPDGGASLQVYGVQGLLVDMSAHDKDTLRKLGGNLDGLFRGATLYPKVNDWR